MLDSSVGEIPFALQTNKKRSFWIPINNKTEKPVQIQKKNNQDLVLI